MATPTFTSVRVLRLEFTSDHDLMRSSVHSADFTNTGTKRVEIQSGGNLIVATQVETATHGAPCAEAA